MNRKQHPKYRRAIRTITTAEVFRLFSGAYTQTTARSGAAYLIAALVCNRVRGGEVSALRWSDVDLDRRVLTLRGGKRGERVVPMPLSLADMFDRYRRVQVVRDRRTGRPPESESAHVFRGRAGAPMTQADVQSVFERHAARALGRPLPLQALRRWACQTESL